MPAHESIELLAAFGGFLNGLGALAAWAIVLRGRYSVLRLAAALTATTGVLLAAWWLIAHQRPVQDQAAGPDRPVIMDCATALATGAKSGEPAQANRANASERLAKGVSPDRLWITMPSPNATVSQSIEVRGQGGVGGLHYYPLITSIEVRKSYVQPELSLGPAGELSGAAQVGDKDTVECSGFLLEIVGTQKTLVIAPLKSTPPDAIRSNSILLYRR